MIGVPRIYGPWRAEQESQQREKFLRIFPCIPASLGYNESMKRQMIEEEKAARLRCMAFGLVYPVTILTCIAIEKIFG